MVKRTTIEIDEELLARAKRALGSTTTRGTVEEALRRAADAAEVVQSERAATRLQYLHGLSERADVELLRSEDMWR